MEDIRTAAVTLRARNIPFLGFYALLIAGLLLAASLLDAEVIFVPVMFIGVNLLFALCVVILKMFFTLLKK